MASKTQEVSQSVYIVTHTTDGTEGHWSQSPPVTPSALGTTELGLQHTMGTDGSLLGSFPPPQPPSPQQTRTQWGCRRSQEAPLCLQLSFFSRSHDPFLPGGERAESGMGPLCTNRLQVGKRICAEYILSPQAARWNRALAGREGVKLNSLRAGQDDTYVVQDRW